MTENENWDEQNICLSVSLVYEICHSVFSKLVKDDTLSLDRRSCIKSSGLGLHLSQKMFDFKFLDFDLENVMQSVDIILTILCRISSKF